MKNFVISNIKFITFLGCAILLASCEYETDVRPADYPGQMIYMPAAYNGPMVINSISQPLDYHPVEGSPSKYAVDIPNRKFMVPLAVYRSGVNNKGAFDVDISVHTDTISKLINSGELGDTTLILPSDKFSLVNKVYMADGDELAEFDLIVDLDFLLDSYPDKVYAIGISIQSTERETNPNLNTTIVVIDTRIMKPTANFDFEVDLEADPTSVTFSNKSQMAVSYLWDFGDGSTSTEKSPTHTYPSSVIENFYTVTLTAVGIAGTEDVMTKSTEEVAPPTWTEGVVIAKGLISPNFTITKWRADIFPENMETGTSAVKVNYTHNSGYVIFKINQMDISGFHELAIRVRGGAGSDGHPVRLFITTTAADGVPEGVILQFTLSEDGLFHEYVTSDLKGKTTINKITLQNREINPLALYVERIELR